MYLKFCLLEQTIKAVLSTFYLRKMLISLDKRCAKDYLVKIKDGRGGGFKTRKKE